MKRRQHLKPIAHYNRTRYIERQRQRHARSTAASGDRVARMLAEGLNDPSRARACAQRLLSDYTYAQLGLALYMRCRRTLNPPGDELRLKVVPKGKPGRMNRQERREYRTRLAVKRVKELVSGDA